jgi:hypothetical protein
LRCPLEGYIQYGGFRPYDRSYELIIKRREKMGKRIPRFNTDDYTKEMVLERQEFVTEKTQGGCDI